MSKFTNGAQRYTFSNISSRNFLYILNHQVFLDFWINFSKKNVKHVFYNKIDLIIFSQDQESADFEFGAKRYELSKFVQKLV